MLKTFLQNFLITSIVVLINLPPLIGMEEEILEYADDEISEHEEFVPGKYTEAFMDEVIKKQMRKF